MLEVVAKIVREARVRAKLDPKELAQRSGVPATILDSLESAKPGITTEQLARVAEVLSLDYAALLNGKEIGRVAPSVFLKHAPHQDFDDRDAATLDDALDQARSTLAIRSLLGGPALALQADRFPQRAATSDHPEAPARDGYRLAREVRKWLENPAGLMGDLGSLIERKFGIAVLVSDLQSNRVTAIGLRAGNAAAIVLNARDHNLASNPLLARVYLAHELCHVLFDPSPGGLHIVLDLDSDKRHFVAEQRARAFAAEFLLPLEGLTQLLGQPARVSSLDIAPQMVARVRSEFVTPHEIAANHLCNHKFIHSQIRDWLGLVKTTFTGEVPSLSLPRKGEASLFLSEETQRAHKLGLLTDAEARQTLRLDLLAPLPWDEVEL